MILFAFLTEHQIHILAAILTLCVLFFAVLALGAFLSARQKRSKGEKSSGQMEILSKYGFRKPKKKKRRR